MRQLLGSSGRRKGGQGGGWCGRRGSNAELANNDEGGQRIGVCYGGICTVGVVVRRVKEGGSWGI
jgi:hypothetical protein